MCVFPPPQVYFDATGLIHTAKEEKDPYLYKTVISVGLMLLFWENTWMKSIGKRRLTHSSMVLVCSHRLSIAWYKKVTAWKLNDGTQPLKYSQLNAISFELNARHVALMVIIMPWSYYNDIGVLLNLQHWLFHIIMRIKVHLLWLK